MTDEKKTDVYVWTGEPTRCPFCKQLSVFGSGRCTNECCDASGLSDNSGYARVSPASPSGAPKRAPRREQSSQDEETPSTSRE